MDAQTGRLTVRTAVRTLLACFALVLIPAASASADPFGFQSFSMSTCTDSTCATPSLQAGAHPYSLVTSMVLNQFTDQYGNIEPDGYIADLKVSLPPGVFANPQAVPQCTQAEFVKLTNNPANQQLTSQRGPGCPSDTQIGIISFDAFDGPPGADTLDAGPFEIPVYNMVPPAGVPADFAFWVAITRLRIDLVGGVNSIGGFGEQVTASNLPANTPLFDQTLTLWGDPQEQNTCATTPGQTTNFDGVAMCAAKDLPLLTNPTSCQGAQPTATITADDYADPAADVYLYGSALAVAARGSTATMSSAMPLMSGCEQLQFGSNANPPTIATTPTDHGVAQSSVQRDTPGGLNVDIKLPYDNTPTDLGTPNLQNATVTLPAGFSINPAAASSLQTCTDDQFAQSTYAAITCPTASQIGTVSVTSPALADPLTGHIYLGSQQAGDPFRLFIDVSADGVDARLTGTITSDPTTGQLTTTFTNIPQLPLTDLSLSFNGGPAGVIATPVDCGTFTTSANLTPWSEADAATPSATITVDADGYGGACPAKTTFIPSVNASETSNAGGATTGLNFAFTRMPGQSYLTSIQAVLPTGLLAYLAAVSPCDNSNAAAGTCPASSAIGTTTVSVGAGSSPTTLPGTVYLSGPYEGAPYGLVITVPAVVGPYDLGVAVVRASINIDPVDAHVTINAQLPTSQNFAVGSSTQGVPLRIQNIDLNINRAGFMLNPTNCAPTSGSTTLGGVDPLAGAAFTAPALFGLQFNGCAGLPFTPTLKVTAAGLSSATTGEGVTITETQPPAQANIKTVSIALPMQFAARPAALAASCLAATFNADPSKCATNSIVGQVTAVTPLLSSPLTGPAYMVSHGASGLPSIEVLLSGAGVHFHLSIAIAISAKGRLISTLTAPDVPISSFTLDLTPGSNAALGSSAADLCGASVTSDATIQAQNGATVNQGGPVILTGCPAIAPRVPLRITRHGYRNGIVTVTVNTAAAGRVSLSGSSLARIVYRHVSSAGAVALRVHLSRLGLARLRARKHLWMILRAGLLPASKSAATAHAFVAFSISP